MKFIRYGSLKSQYHDTSGDWVHTPPVAWGFYAFPKGYVEKFLIGGLGEGSVNNGRLRYIRNENGEKIFDKEDNIYEWDGNKGECIYKEPYRTYLFDKLKLDKSRIRVEMIEKDRYNENLEYDNCRFCILYENEPTFFDYDSDIWHHFDKCVNPGDITQRTKYWVKTNIRDYRKALDAYVRIDKYNYMRGETTQNPGGCPMNRIEKDMYEVYIESIQKTPRQSRKNKKH